MSGEVREDQIWREVDPRLERYVKVQRIRSGSSYVVIVRVEHDGSPYPRARSTEVQLDRFNGKRGGYEFVRDTPREAIP